MTPCVTGSASAVPGNEGSTPTTATTMAPIAAPSMIRSATRTTPNSVASFKFSPLYYTAVLGEGYMIAILLTLTIAGVLYAVTRNPFAAARSMAGAGDDWEHRSWIAALRAPAIV